MQNQLKKMMIILNQNLKRKSEKISLTILKPQKTGAKLPKNQKKLRNNSDK